MPDPGITGVTEGPTRGPGEHGAGGAHRHKEETVIVIQLLAVVVALVVLVAMAVGPELKDWHERTPVWHDEPETTHGLAAYKSLAL